MIPENNNSWGLHQHVPIFHDVMEFDVLNPKIPLPPQVWQS